jgi:predicted lipoprotein with Yx(FWY)xxD motif
MRRLLITLGTGAAALILAACGSSGSNGTSGSSSGAATTASGGSAVTVAAAQVDGVGKILVDSSGHALYSPEQEANGTILCTDTCTSFWKPLMVTGTPTAGSGVAQLGVVDRPDGSKQVTAEGKPLYTFVQDKAGQVNGNGFSDQFGSQHFTWHAVLANGSVASAPAATTPGTSGGYGDSGY